MAAGYPLPSPTPLEIHDPQVSEKWKTFRRAWNSYALALELDKKEEKVQVAILLTVIGEEAREVFSTFTGWDSEGDESKITPVLTKFEEYCQPRKNIPFERYCFNRRQQESGETYEQYRTALRKLSQTCDFQSITPDELLRDRLVFGIRDDKVRERLLRESTLTLAKTDEICRAAESMMAQMKVVSDSGSTTVSAVKSEPNTEEKLRPDPTKQTRECWNCGRRHPYHRRELCPAYGKTCKKCRKPNHFAAKCRSKEKGTGRDIRAVEVEDMDEVFPTQFSVLQVDDSQLVTVQLQSGNYLRFQVDTGAQCNVIPLNLYKQATQDNSLTKVTPANTCITAYGGATLPVVGTVAIWVQRGTTKSKLTCKLVNSTNIRPLLGRSACLQMNIISYLDNDALNKPKTGSCPVYALDSTTAISKEGLIQQHPKVFGPGVGLLEGKYHISIDSAYPPVQHSPRRIPVAIRDQLKCTLEDLTRQNIIQPVTEPTPWISSMVIITKKNGTLRICLDPKDLNSAIRREHYPLPTIEEVATRLHGAKLFTSLDVRSGFWHIALDEPSSFLTTFHTPFGRYRWKRMPFGICSAPEIFQRRMHEMIEGLQGVEVVADDFVIVGRGETTNEAMKDHDTNLGALLHRCAEKGVKLNPDKIKLRMKEVPFIGHVATSEGLCVDPSKVAAIMEMPLPTNIAAVQRLLGLAQYLSKFLPHLSQITKPLRVLTQKDTEWVWESAQQQAFDDLKKAVSCTPVLRYYNVKEAVTLQCDASQSGLGAALLQAGQPVAYASRALTSTESRYAQIEKELLAIVFACEHFEAYIYGREVVHIETDHKPLEMIVLKPLDKAPKRLQCMLLRLQKYSLQVQYKRGVYMYLADTLSRAHRPEVHACGFYQNLEEMDQTSSLALSQDRLQEIRHASADDPVLKSLRKTIQEGWPQTKLEVPELVRPYFNIRDELTLQDQLVFKGQSVIIPATMRKHMMNVVHATHIGIEGCIRRARESMYWPRMTAELKDYISKCDICLTHRASPGKEPLIQHKFGDRPWSKVGVDLCELHGRTLLVVVDYYSNFIEVDRPTTTITSGICKSLKGMFSRYGIPDQLVSDNGPQFSSVEFTKFAKEWAFQHVTSSPRYPQSNGKVENSVKTVKRLFSKCKDSGQSEHLALLDWRNTPSEGMGTSPAQRFLGRRCKTLLPTTKVLLHPRYSTEEDTEAIRMQKTRQQSYYDRHVKELRPIQPGQPVQMRLPGKDTWTTGTCLKTAGPRSYEVQVDGRTYRRNRRQLIQVDKDPPTEEPITPSHESEVQTPPRPAMESSDVTDQGDPPRAGPRDKPNSTSLPPSTSPRRSGRVTQRPTWMADYVPSDTLC